MNTIKISPGLHFRDLVKTLGLDLKDESLLFLLPDIPSVVQAEEVFLEQGGIWGERILTFGKLAHMANLASEYPKNYLSRTGRLLIMEEVLQNIERDFDYFVYINNIREFSDSVLRVIAELKHSGINHHSFTNLVTKRGPDSIHSKIRDFSKLYGQYALYLESYGYIDDIDSLTMLCDFITDGFFNRICPGIKRILCHGFNDFTDSQIKVLDALVGMGIKVDVLLYENGTALAGDQLTVYGFESVTEEVQHCAKEVSRLLSNEQVKPSDIAVIAGSLQEYSNIIYSEFNKSGIRHSQSATPPLISSTVGKLINDILLLKISGFKKHHLFNILRNPYVIRLSGDPARTYRDVALYELNSLKKRVVRGAECWKGLLEDVSNPYSPEFIKISNQIFNLVDKRFTSKKIRELNRDLISIMEELVYERMRDRGCPDSIPEYNSLKKSFDLLKEYDFLIRNIFSDRNVENLSHYLQLISDLLSEERYSLTGEHKEDQVKVLSMLEARGTAFKYVFVLGAGEKNIPNPVRHDPIIKDHERYVLNKEFNKNMLRTKSEMVDCEIQLFINTLRSARNTIVSFVNLDSNGLPVQPAYPVEDYYSGTNNNGRGNGVIAPDVLKKPYTEQELFNQIFASHLHIEDKFKNKLPSEYKYCCRGINSEYSRMRRSASLSVYEGLVSTDTGLSGRNSFTVTELETYGDCPFMYFASRILNLDFPDESTDEPQPLDLGSLYHRIIHEFFNELSISYNNRLDLSNVSDNDIKSKLEIFLKSWDLNGLFPWLSDHRKTLLIKRIKKVVIPLFILNESERIRANNASGIYPVYFEKDHEYVIDENTRIKGKSDRIDTSSDHALVIDYKFGSVNGRKFSDYRNLQLPLYLLAMNSINYESYGGYYRSVEKPDQQKGMECKSKNFTDEIDKALDYAMYYIKNIRSGHFPADPKEKIYESQNPMTEIIKKREAPCVYCAYSDLCRANRRVFRKNSYEE